MLRSRLAPLAVLLLVVGCDILTPREVPEEAQVLEFVTTGFLEFEHETVWVQHGEKLDMKFAHPETTTRRDDPAMGIARYYSVPPLVFRCTDVDRTINSWEQVWTMAPLPCVLMFDNIRLSRPHDTEWVPLAEVAETVDRLFPCRAKIEEARQNGGGIIECATASYTRIVPGPGIRCGGDSDICDLMATGCGETWLERVKLDGWKEPWPEPFDGYARIEVQIAC